MIEKKSGERDSNPRIFALQANALAAGPPPQFPLEKKLIAFITIWV